MSIAFTAAPAPPPSRAFGAGAFSGAPPGAPPGASAFAELLSGHTARTAPAEGHTESAGEQALRAAQHDRERQRSSSSAHDRDSTLAQAGAGNAHAAARTAVTAERLRAEHTPASGRDAGARPVGENQPAPEGPRGCLRRPVRCGRAGCRTPGDLVKTVAFIH